MATRKKPASGDATSLLPIPKIAAAAGLGTPLAVVIAFIYGELGGDMPVEVACALGALIAAAVGYLKSSRGYLNP